MKVYVTLCTKQIPYEDIWNTSLRSVHLSEEKAEEDLEEYVLIGDRLLSFERRKKVIHDAECCITEEIEVIE